MEFPWRLPCGSADQQGGAYRMVTVQLAHQLRVPLRRLGGSLVGLLLHVPGEFQAGRFDERGDMGRVYDFVGVAAHRRVGRTATVVDLAIGIGVTGTGGNGADECPLLDREFRKRKPHGWTLHRYGKGAAAAR
jgi:hypothetical protein